MSQMALCLLASTGRAKKEILTNLEGWLRVGQSKMEYLDVRVALELEVVMIDMGPTFQTEGLKLEM